MDAVLGRFYFVFISLFRARTKRTLIGNFRCKESGRESAPLAVHSCGLRERDGEGVRESSAWAFIIRGWVAWVRLALKYAGNLIMYKVV